MIFSIGGLLQKDILQPFDNNGIEEQIEIWISPGVWRISLVRDIPNTIITKTLRGINNNESEKREWPQTNLNKRMY